MPEPRGFSATEARQANRFAEALPAADRAEFLERLRQAVADQPREMPGVIFRMMARRIWAEMKQSGAA